jgi:hypothetical protein
MIMLRESSLCAEVAGMDQKPAQRMYAAMIC